MSDRLEVLSAEAAYRESRFRESRDPSGALTFVEGDARLKVIAGMPVVNVETNEVESL